MPIFFWSCTLHESTNKKCLILFFRQYFRFKLPQENSEIRHLCAGSLIWRRIIFFCKFICRKPKPYIKYKSGKTFLFFVSHYKFVRLFVVFAYVYGFDIQNLYTCISIVLLFNLSRLFVVVLLGFPQMGMNAKGEKWAKMLDSVLKNIEEIKYSFWPLLPTCALLWFHLCWMLWQANRIRHYS